jgi:hypothetical protein
MYTFSLTLYIYHGYVSQFFSFPPFLFCLSRTLSLSHTHTHSLSHTLSHTHTISLSLSLSYTLPPPLSLSLCFSVSFKNATPFSRLLHLTKVVEQEKVICNVSIPSAKKANNNNNHHLIVSKILFSQSTLSFHPNLNHIRFFVAIRTLCCMCYYYTMYLCKICQKYEKIK